MWRPTADPEYLGFLPARTLHKFVRYDSRAESFRFTPAFYQERRQRVLQRVRLDVGAGALRLVRNLVAEPH